ncbi:MAG: ABC transporter permease, partial [Bacillota bacterium]
MRLPEILRLVFMNIKQNKFKVFLTSLGIIVGTATIVMVIAIGEGGKQDVAEQFKNLNAGTITVTSNGLMTGGMQMGGGMTGRSSGGGGGTSG